MFSLNYVPFPFTPQNTYTDAVHATDAQAYYRVSVRVAERG